MIYSLLWYFASEKQKLSQQVDAQYEEIRLEKDRSERLLLNILPPAIAERLKRNEINIAQGHADVTVMFADIVGFTRMTEELSPVETVKILNDESSSVMRVKPTMSANITVTSAWPCAMLISFRFRRSAMAGGRMLSSRRSLRSFSRRISSCCASTCWRSFCFSEAKYHSSE